MHTYLHIYMYKYIHTDIQIYRYTDIHVISDILIY